MRLHRFYIGGKKDGQNRELSSLSTDSAIVLDGAKYDDFAGIIHQWRDVFRYTVGSKVVLFDDSGVEFLGMIESFQGSKVRIILIEKIDIVKESTKNNETLENDSLISNIDNEQGGKKDMGGTSNPGVLSTNSTKGEIWLFLSILKGENFDLVVQKVTELGINHIVPILSDRTIKKNVNLTRLHKIAVEASEQSGRKDVPQIYEPVSLKEAVDSFIIKDGEMVICHQHGDVWAKSAQSLKKYPLGFMVGPEGGWSEKEEKYFEKMALRKIKFSENVLRAETAAIGVVTLVKAEKN